MGAGDGTVVISLRRYVSALVLLAGSAALLATSKGTKLREAAGAAGFALLGAAVTRALDISERRHRAQEEARAERKRDLDETRRLCYMALLGGTTAHIDLAATLVNALVHHGSADLGEAAGYVPTVVNTGDGAYEAAEWLKAQVSEINDTLDEMERPRRRRRPQRPPVVEGNS